MRPLLCLFLSASLATAAAPPLATPPAFTAEQSREDRKLRDRLDELIGARKFAEATQAAEALAAHRARHLGQRHPLAAEARAAAAACGRAAKMSEADLRRLDRLLRQQGRGVKLSRGDGPQRAEAVDLLERSLAGARELLGERDYFTVVAYRSLGVALFTAGRLAEARPVLERAVPPHEHVLGAGHRSTAEMRHALGRVLVGLGEPERAAAFLRRAIDSYAAGDPRDRALPAACSDLVNALAKLGRYEEAEGWCLETLARTRRLHGENHPETAAGYNNLASVYARLGRIAEARALQEKALAITAEHLGEDHLQTAIALYNLSLTLRAQNDLPRSLELAVRALAICRDQAGKRDLRTANACSNLGNTYLRMGLTAKALPLLREAAETTSRLFPADHPEVLATRHELGAGLLASGKHDEALKLLDDAAAGLAKRLGDDHLLTVLAVRSRGRALQEQGKDEEALKPLRAAHGRALARLGKHHRATCELAGDVGFSLYRLGKYEEAETVLAAAESGFARARVNVTAGGLEDRADEGKAVFAWLASAQVRNGKPRAAWQTLEGGLARLLRDEQALRERFLDTQQRRRREEIAGALLRCDQQLEALAAARTEKAKEAAAPLIRRRDVLGVELAQFDARFARAFSAGPAADLASVQKQLAPDSALLAWLDFDPRQSEALACVVRAKGDPVWVRLPLSEKSAAEVVALRKYLTQRPADAGWLGAARKVYRARVEPLRKHLDGVRHVIVLPSPTMASIPLEAIQQGRPEGAPEWTVSYAPSGSVYAGLRQRPRPAGDARLLALGDPAYARPAKGELAGLTRGHYKPLPGTRREVEAIAGLFGDSDKLLGGDASAARLRELADAGRLKRYRYLHLAAHGQARPEPMASLLALADEKQSDPVRALREGKPPAVAELTAREVLRTWKLDADLVALSACQTGLGKYDLAEGYVGFAQALFVAGARSVVVSQWSVDDEATALLMVRFYENLLAKRKGTKPMAKAEALREAKEWLRDLTAKQISARVAALPRGKEVAMPRVREEARPFAHPYYWAAFVLVGDPG